MPLTCPVCRAANDAGPACRRCKADLSLVAAVLAAHTAETAAARRLAAADPPAAAAHAARALALRSDAAGRSLLAITRLLAGDFAAALAAGMRSVR